MPEILPRPPFLPKATAGKKLIDYEGGEICQHISMNYLFLF